MFTSQHHFWHKISFQFSVSKANQDKTANRSEEFMIRIIKLSIEIACGRLVSFPPAKARSINSNPRILTMIGNHLLL